MPIEHPTIKCVERAANFIAAQLQDGDTPSLDAIAAASGLSKFHFHRVYRLVTGETCAQTITRLRLALGAGTLQTETATITQAAMAANYSSSQAFAKAMKRTLNDTATNLRNDPERLASAIEILSEPSGETPGALKIELCSLEPFEIMVIRTTDSYPALNETYWQLVEASGGFENIRAILGIPHRDIETFEQSGFTFDCALAPNAAVKDLPAEISQRQVSGGQYLMTRHTGLDARLPDSFDGLYQFILENPSIRIADEPCLLHYVDDPEEVPEENCRTDIYVKIETAKN